MYSSASIKYYILITIFSSFISCTYHNEEELYPIEVECIEGEMSYSNDIEPILTNYGCNSCHSSQAPLKLGTHAEVMDYVKNGLLVGSIVHDRGVRPMPEGQSKMDNCSIEKIKKWIEEGAKNN
jgi:hypothetical protein